MGLASLDVDSQVHAFVSVGKLNLSTPVLTLMKMGLYCLFSFYVWVEKCIEPVPEHWKIVICIYFFRKLQIEELNTITGTSIITSTNFNTCMYMNTRPGFFLE